MDISVVGAGRAGVAVAVLWQRAGHRVVAASGRAATPSRVRRHLPGVPTLDAADAAGRAELVVLGVPDDAIEPVADALAAARVVEGRWIVHLSGATPIAALDGARARGARPLAIHPLQTFPDVESAVERIPGCAVALGAHDEEGWTLAERLAGDLGGRAFRLREELRATYHAAAVFASNYLVAATGVAELLLAEAGIADPLAAIAPLQRATISNVSRSGPGGALTGPAVRGDAGTIARHLEALDATAPWAVDAYIEMARVSLDLAERTGRLRSSQRASIDGVLAGWS